MAYMCKNGYHRECDGCGRCQECDNNQPNYDDIFYDDIEPICENIYDRLDELEQILHFYENEYYDELQEYIRLTSKSLEEMRSGLQWIY